MVAHISLSGTVHLRCRVHSFVQGPMQVDKFQLAFNETMNLFVHPDLDYCILSMLMGSSLEAS